MKKTLLALASLAVLGLAMNSAQAQEVYGGIGMPGLVMLGYSTPLAKDFGGRIELGTGLNYSLNGNRDGVEVNGKFKSDTAGAFVDWFPVARSAFRFVGGVTVNNTKAELNAAGTGMAMVNGVHVNMAGETYNVNVKFADVTPYIGIGYGHAKTFTKGLGFYADVGLMLGDYTVTTNTSLVKNGKVSQADVDAQSMKLRDGFKSTNFMPSVSLGATYRF